MRYRHGFLVATLRHQEEPFSQSVIYMCEHSAQGSLGFVINKPLALTVKDLIKSSSGIGVYAPVFLGGPMKMNDRGFVLHRNLGRYWQGTSQLASDLYLTTTDDLIQDIFQYPEDLYKVCVGYTGWQEGQLEHEISQDYWLWMSFDSLALFYIAHQDTWRHCYSVLGFSPDQIGCVDPGVVFKH